MNGLNVDCEACRELARGLITARLDNDYSRESDIKVLIMRHHEHVHTVTIDLRKADSA